MLLYQQSMVRELCTLIFLKSLFNIKIYQSQDFFINNELVNDPNIIVNEFNAYFVNIAKNLADGIPVADHFSTYLNDPSDNTFKFDLVTEQDVAYIIHNLKK